MKGILVLSAALLLSGAAHAQGSLTGSSISPIVINATQITSYSRINRGCNCTSVIAQNDGQFSPSEFESFEQAVLAGELALKSGHPDIVEIARQTREQKRAASQAARLVAVQDDRGRLVYTPQP